MREVPPAALAPTAGSPPEANPALEVGLSPQSTPPPAGALRADLEKVLEPEGDRLAVADEQATVPSSESVTPLSYASPPPVELSAAEAPDAADPATRDGAAAELETAQPAAFTHLREGSRAEPITLTQPQRLPRIATAEQSAPPPVRATRTEDSTRLAAAPALRTSSGISTPPPPLYVQSYPVAVVNGEPLGAITLRDFGAQGMAIHLGALVELLKLRMPEAEFARLSSAAAADQFVSLDRLRAAGIAIEFDPRKNSLLIDAR